MSPLQLQGDICFASFDVLVEEQYESIPWFFEVWFRVNIKAVVQVYVVGTDYQHGGPHPRIDELDAASFFLVSQTDQ